MNHLKVLDIFNLAGRKTDGLFGVEIEVEANGLPNEVPRQWVTTQDSSLRGESAEYVLRRPLLLDQSITAVESLYKNFDKAGTKVHDSVRAGVHVHINVQDLTLTQVMNIATTYWIVEDAMVHFCGDSRVGNLFCLRSKDAEYLNYMLKKSLITKRLNLLASEDIRYASLNFNSLAKYGSLEFRAMHTTTSTEPIVLWIKLLDKLRSFAIQCESPSKIIQNFSLQGIERFYDEVFGELSLELDYEGLSHDTKEGMRQAQEVAFCVDWVVFEEELKKSAQEGLIRMERPKGEPIKRKPNVVFRRVYRNGNGRGPVIDILDNVMFKEPIGDV